MKKNENHRLVKIIFRKSFTDSLSLLRVERGDLIFQPGQYFFLGLPLSDEMRPYSVFSGIEDPWIDFVIQKIQQGGVAEGLTQVQPGQWLKIEGPKGFFTLPPSYHSEKLVVMIATGTGIAPFHSFIRSYPELNYRLLYGARKNDELLGLETFDMERIITVLSRQPDWKIQGRVTDHLERIIFPEALYMVCGNSEMVSEVTALLHQKIGKNTKVRTEYF
ncbi:MAG TPA: FAD-binding oxidoreductase [Salinivirgaceae bacterium]|nr:FAD-binding oxidoreductase [Salinivirgaceae bacterium]